MSSAADIADFILSNDFFLISTHVFPDGDNMGSVLALMEGLEALGKKHACYIEGPIPRTFQWMPGVDGIDTDLRNALKELSFENHLALLVVDSGDLHRVGESLSKWTENRDGLAIANIDHHTSNTFFGTVNWVDPSYSSVGEMVFEILGELNVKLTPSIAQNLYASVYTDTGRFSFSNTSERSLRYAAAFVAAGAKPVKAYFGIYANRSLDSFQLQAESFKTLSRFLDDRGVYFWVDRKMMASTNTALEDTEGFIDIMRTLQGFEIMAFFKEVDETDIRVSVRAAPPINASRLMAKFGGGGHPRAAGCRINRSLQEAIKKFVAVAEEAIESGEVLEENL